MKLHCNRIKSSPPSPTRSTVPVACLAVLNTSLLTSALRGRFCSASGHSAFQPNRPKPRPRRVHGNLPVGESPSVSNSEHEVAPTESTLRVPSVNAKPTLDEPFHLPKPQGRAGLLSPSQSCRSLEHLSNWDDSEGKYPTVKVSSETGRAEELIVPHDSTWIPGCSRRPNEFHFTFVNSNRRAKVERCVLREDNKVEIRGILTRLQNSRILWKSQNFARVDDLWVGGRGKKELELFILRLCEGRGAVSVSVALSLVSENPKALPATIANGLAELHSAGLVMGRFDENDLQVENGRWLFTNLDRIKSATKESSEREKIEDWNYAIKVLAKLFSGGSKMQNPGEGISFSSPAAAEEYVRKRFGARGGSFTKLQPVKRPRARTVCNLKQMRFRIREYKRSLHETPDSTSTDCSQSDANSTEDSSEAFWNDELEGQTRL